MFRWLRARLRRFVAAQYVFRRLRWYLFLRFERSPWSVAIETAGSCNRKCSYCPVSVHERSGEMPRELFLKIMDDLAAIGFERTISFHFYNEPLMDRRLPELVAQARTRLPRCTLDLFTNGDFLTSDWISSLLDAGIGVIRVSLHSESSERHVRRVLDSVDDGARERIVFDSFFDRRETGGFLYNRLEMAETSPATGRPTVIGGGCSLVNSLSINYEGDTALCCNDFFAANGHGNLADVSVRQIWRQSRAVRRGIYLGKYDKPICQTCNIGGGQRGF